MNRILNFTYINPIYIFKKNKNNSSFISNLNMNKSLLTLLLAFNLLASLSANETSDKSSNNDWASKYNNGPSNGPNSSLTNSVKFDYKDFYIKFTCPIALQKANKGISEFTTSVKTAKDQWSTFAAAEKLNGLSYYIQHGCNVDNLKVVNQGTTGLNKTQDDACANLTTLIESLLGKGELVELSSNWMKNFDISNKALALQKSIGPNCNLTVVEANQEELNVEIEEEEEENHDSVSESFEEVAQIETEENSNEADENDNNQVSDRILLSPSHKNSHHGEDKEGEAEEEENEESIEKVININEEKLNREDSFTNQDFAIIIDEMKDGQQDSYIIYYHPEPNGEADIIIAHTIMREVLESDLDSEEEENKIEYIEK